ncbi:hypothetical protein, partial [Escherichia coli]|uniref:hypothetical protein n=1 Tax=Escherichia coli TaxID=562 RepID=UPI001FCF00F5
MKYNNIIFLGLCLGLTTYSALSADSVIKISGRVLDYGCTVLMNPLMILVKIIKLRWIHILSYDQMVSPKINNQTTKCANSI